MTFTHLLVGIFQLSSVICDVIGSSVFYLTSMRVIQVIGEKYQVGDKTGKLFAAFVVLYALSILVGYAISYKCYAMVPLWLYLIILASMALLSGVFCFFAFPMEGTRRVRNELNEERGNPQDNVNNDSNRG